MSFEVSFFGFLVFASYAAAFIGGLFAGKRLT